MDIGGATIGSLSKELSTKSFKIWANLMSFFESSLVANATGNEMVSDVSLHKGMPHLKKGKAVWMHFKCRYQYFLNFSLAHFRFDDLTY